MIFWVSSRLLTSIDSSSLAIGARGSELRCRSFSKTDVYRLHWRSVILAIDPGT
jgi:hypothetical protein